MSVSLCDSEGLRNNKHLKRRESMYYFFIYILNYKFHINANAGFTKHRIVCLFGRLFACSIIPQDTTMVRENINFQGLLITRNWYFSIGRMHFQGILLPAQFFFSVDHVHINLRAFCSLLSWGAYSQKNVWWNFWSRRTDPFLPEVSAPTSRTVKLKKLYVNFLLNTQSLIDMSVSVKEFAAYNEYFYLRGRIWFLTGIKWDISFSLNEFVNYKTTLRGVIFTKCFQQNSCVNRVSKSVSSEIFN